MPRFTGFFGDSCGMLTSGFMSTSTGIVVLLVTFPPMFDTSTE